MANRKTQKKREREAAKKLVTKSYLDYNFPIPDDLRKIKMEGDDSDGDRITQYRVPRGAPIPSGKIIGEH